MRCAITGAGGYLGRVLSKSFTAQGWDIVCLTRRGGDEKNVQFQLAKTDPEKIPWQNVDALVHGAWDFSLTRWEEIHRVNVLGSIALLRAAKNAGVKRVVFISTFSAFEGCRSLYGRAKLEIEKEALTLGCAVVRPGLVYGPGATGGTMGQLENAAKRGGIVPLLGDGSFAQFPVHEDDLARLIFLLCQPDAPIPREPISAAPAQKITLRELVETIAKKNNQRVFFVPLPWRILLAGLKTLEALHLPAPFRSDSLLGIVFQNPAPKFGLPESLPLRFRNYEP